MNVPVANSGGGPLVNARAAISTLFVAAALMASQASAIAASAAGGPCGGTANLQCAQDLWCQKPVGTCGKADVSGTCIKLELFCGAISQPVCGCDGKEYGNACDSQGKTQIDFSNRCTDKPK